MTDARIIVLSAREAKLKRRIRQHLRNLGFTKGADGWLEAPSMDKDAYRRFHDTQRGEKLASNADWLAHNQSSLLKHFAAGSEVDPTTIRPRLELISGGTWQSDLFRMAALFWRVPVSDGYGRRIRFLVWDESNDKLIGLIALGDAVFNQKARDEFVDWDHNRRSASLVNLMDAYVLGAVPPYNMLLGGKLIASLIRTADVVKAFDRKYRDSIGIISREGKKARLVAVTTSSALGRSSVYNRVALNGRKILEPIGYTSGWGHFHFSGAIFDELRNYLEFVGDDYSNGFSFGSGPNWKIRVIRRSLQLLGMDPSLIRHGFQREVFFCRIADNALPYLRGEHRKVMYGRLPTAIEVGESARERWLIGRAARDCQYKEWMPYKLLEAIKESGSRNLTPRSRRNVSGA
jgi:hypothetical protein